MTLKGHVRNGVIVLDEPADLKEGARVSVRLLPERTKTSRKKTNALTLYERLKPVIGKSKGLPPDSALNHDHYLYGLPKK